MTQAFNLSQFANNVNSAGVAQTGGGGTGTNIASNDLTVNGLTVGKGGGAVATNTAVGTGALVANTTGAENTAFGYVALRNVTTGGYGTAVGTYALYTNTTGSFNSALGDSALYNNSTGANNTAIGYNALISNTTASNNTAVGYQSAYSNVTGTGIVAIGESALKASTGNNNTAVGKSGLTANTTGVDNSTVGKDSLGSNTTGSYNTALGSNALVNNTTASNNTAVGYQAGYSNTTGVYNVYFGQAAGYSATTGTSYSCFIGAQAGQNTTGTQNHFFGQGAGQYVTSGAKNVILGGYGGNSGGLDIRTSSNNIVLSDGDGNPRIWTDNTGLMYVPQARLQTTANASNLYVDSSYWIARSTSALKYKQDIRTLESIDVNKFRPVRYKSACKNDDQEKDHFGIIADEVDEAGFKELVSYGADGEVEGFQYERFTVVLLKAIQEQQAIITDLQARLTKAGL